MQKNFTLNYFQPDEYHFSLDSVLFAKRLSEDYSTHPKLQELRFLDLCSGCGVIGLEMFYFLPQICHFDFIEIQECYLEYFKKNLQLFSPVPSFNFILANYKEFYSETRGFSPYDVIVCNPPYFFKQEGHLSPSEFKNRCRFFLDASLRELLLAINELLKVGGQAHILLQLDQEYKVLRWEKLKEDFKDSFHFASREKIRITDWVCLTKI